LDRLVSPEAAESPQMQFRVKVRTSAGRRGNEGQKTSDRLGIACDHDFLTLG
jgi:hypothetical protein